MTALVEDQQGVWKVILYQDWLKELNYNELNAKPFTAQVNPINPVLQTSSL